MRTEAEEKGVNADNPLVKLVHHNLPRVVKNDLYKSVCPFCYRGNLPMTRDPHTKKLLRTDKCDCCAQRVEYLDFDDLPFVVVENRKKTR